MVSMNLHHNPEILRHNKKTLRHSLRYTSSLVSKVGDKLSVAIKYVTFVSFLRFFSFGLKVKRSDDFFL